MSKKIILLSLLLFLLLAGISSCETTDENGNGNTDIKDPTNFELGKNDDEEWLRTHIKALFENIEEKIAKADYQGWYDALSREYRRYIDDPAILKEMSISSDFLYNRNIIMKSSKDYFEYVVIGSRENRKMEYVDYEIIDKYTIKVLCKFDNNDKFKYYYNFIYEDGSWKLDR